MFPCNGWLTENPLPRPAPGGVARWPASTVLPGSPTPARPSALAHWVRQEPTCVGSRWFAPTWLGANQGARGHYGSVAPARPKGHRKRTGLPGSWATLMQLCLGLRPRRHQHARPGRRASTAPAAKTPRAGRDRLFRGSIARPDGWLSTLRADGRPAGRKTHFRLLAKLCRVGLATHRVATKGFRSFLHPSPFPRLRLAQFSARSPLRSPQSHRRRFRSRSRVHPCPVASILAIR
jgi:hypothetical protein